MDLVVYDDDDKRYVPWAVALAAVLLVALLTAVLTFLVARQATGEQGERAVSGVGTPEPATAPTSPSATPSSAAPTSTPTVAATPAPACVAALQQADAALTRAVALDQALSQHTQILDELRAGRIDAQQALDRALPVLTDGATQGRLFEQELSAYSLSRQECPAQ